MTVPLADVNILDTIVGVIVGSFTVFAIVAILFKYRIIQFGRDQHISRECVDYAKDLAFAAKSCEELWREIKDINERQRTLREKLPVEYVSKADLINIQDRLKSIDSKLDRFVELNVYRCIDKN